MNRQTHPSPLTRTRRSLLALGLIACAGLSQGQGLGLEERFREYIERLRAMGTRLPDRLLGSPFEVQRPSLTPRVDKLPLGQNEVVVFTAPGCRRCEHALQELRRQGTDVKVMDITRSPVARDSYHVTGAKGVPAILVGSQLLTGWDRKLYQQATVNSVQDKLKQQAQEGGA